MGAQEELDRLAACLARAVPGSTVGYAKMREVGGAGGEVYAKVIVDKVGADALDDDAKVVTSCCADDDAAVAELRAILRADTSGAVADAIAAERAKIAALLDAYLAADDMLLGALDRGLVRDEYHPAAVDRTSALDALRRAVRP